MKPKLVLDERSLPQLDWAGGLDAEAQPGRGDALEVFGAGEEIENGGASDRQLEFAVETIGSQNPMITRTGLQGWSTISPAAGPWMRILHW